MASSVAAPMTSSAFFVSGETFHHILHECTDVLTKLFWSILWASCGLSSLWSALWILWWILRIRWLFWLLLAVGGYALSSECCEWMLSMWSLPVATKFTAATSSSSSVSVAISSSASVASTSHPRRHIVPEESRVFSNILLNISLSIRHRLINHSKDGLWCLAWILNLQESMVMTSSLLACFTEVEVLADAALVSHTLNWSLATAIALNILMKHWS